MPRRLLVMICLLLLVAAPCRAAPLADDLPPDAADMLPELEQFDFPALEESFPDTEVPWADGWIDIRGLLLDPGRALEMLNPTHLLHWLGEQVLNIFVEERFFLLQLVALGAFSGILRLFSEALQSEQLRDSLRWMLGLIYFIVLALRLREAIALTQQTVEQLSGVMVTMLPGITFYWTAAASLSNLALFKPIVIASVQMATQLAANWIMPALISSSLLTLVSVFSQPINLKKLAGLLRNLGITLLATAMLVVVGLTSVQGKLSAAADGALIAGGKYLIKNTLPVVGSVAADALEMTAGTTLVLGQAVGWLGTITIIAGLIHPCIKLLMSALLLKIGAAALAPFAESHFVEGVDGVGDAVLYFFALVLMIGIFFYLMLTTLVGLQDISLLLRM